jgi:hypothetical protein
MCVVLEIPVSFLMGVCCCCDQETIDSDRLRRITTHLLEKFLLEAGRRVSDKLTLTDPIEYVYRKK